MVAIVPDRCVEVHVGAAASPCCRKRLTFIVWPCLNCAFISLLGLCLGYFEVYVAAQRENLGGRWSHR